jgi:hypothetical protein
MGIELTQCPGAEHGWRSSSHRKGSASSECSCQAHEGGSRISEDTYERYFRRKKYHSQSQLLRAFRPRIFGIKILLPWPITHALISLLPSMGFQRWESFAEGQLNLYWPQTTPGSLQFRVRFAFFVSNFFTVTDL